MTKPNFSYEDIVARNAQLQAELAAIKGKDRVFWDNVELGEAIARAEKAEAELAAAPSRAAAWRTCAKELNGLLKGYSANTWKRRDAAHAEFDRLAAAKAKP
jgi:hypothetical protein